MEDLRVELELKESLAVTKDALVNSKDTTIARLETRCKQLTEQVEQQFATIKYTQNELVSKATKIAQLETDITNLTAQVEQEQADKNFIIAHKDFIITTKDSLLASKETSLQKKEATNQSLNNQLTKTRDYLTSKPQVSSSTLSARI